MAGRTEMVKRRRKNNSGVHQDTKSAHTWSKPGNMDGNLIGGALMNRAF